MSSLYLEHFRLNEAPFGITPNGRFFFEGQARGAILEALHHAVLDEDGIVVVVGEVGSGKTMLCRMLAERLPREQVDVVYLANPSFGPREILQSLIADWGLRPSVAGLSQVLTIQNALLERHAQGRRAVVLIDEAQAMQPESLEEIKLLSNLETDQHKLLQIVLFGQPELDDLLALPKLRQVRDRVVHRFELQPLNEAEAAAYIEHRLRRAGWQGGALFEARALRQLIDASGGRIRAIHLLADKALLAAFAQGARQVCSEHVRLAMSELPGRAPSVRGQAALPASVGARRLSKWAGAACAGLAALGIVGVAGYGLGQRSVVAPMPEVVAAAPVASVAAESSAALAFAPTSVPPASPASQSVALALASAAAPAAGPASASSATSSEARQRQSVTDLQRRYADWPAPLREAVLRTRAVFDDPAQEFWVIQIGVASDVAGALALMQKLSQSEAETEVWMQDRVYVGQASGAAMHVLAVYAGRFPDRSSAMQRLQKWPDSLKTFKPLPRSLLRLRTEAYPERVPS